MIKVPNMKSPCANCPFRKDTMKGWLGAERMKEILAQDSFVCHKTVDEEKGIERKQCAGHMSIKGFDNAFVRTANNMGINVNVSNREVLFDSEADCVEHHRIASRER